MYRSYELSGPAIVFTLGLYVATLQGRSSVGDGSGDVLILCWGEEQYLLGWVCKLLLFGIVGMVKVLLLSLFLCQQKFQTCSMSTGVEGLLGCWRVLLCRISWGEGMLGPMGVDCRSRRSYLSDLPASCVVLRMALMVLT